MRKTNFIYYYNPSFIYFNFKHIYNIHMSFCFSIMFFKVTTLNSLFLHINILNFNFVLIHPPYLSYS